MANLAVDGFAGDSSFGASSLELRRRVTTHVLYLSF